MPHSGSDGREGLIKLRKLCCARSLKVATFFLFSVAITPISSTAAPPKPVPAEPLEQYEDPPMHIFRLGISQQMVSAFGAFTSYQVNVDANGNNITGDAANEPSITVDPTNHDQMAIGWRQFDSVGSNFRQAGWGY